MRSEEISNCPICSGALRTIGSRSRMMIDSGGTPMTIIIRRLRCGQCGKVHHELPDTVIPYKRHCAETIERIIDGKIEEVCCEECICRRDLTPGGGLD